MLLGAGVLVQLTVVQTALVSAGAQAPDPSQTPLEQITLVQAACGSVAAGTGVQVPGFVVTLQALRNRPGRGVLTG
jgi:hypothetical protein